ncbi:DUF4013 domain-containing protein [Halomarina halobia]|uniref:DUF4013 domain-containing protein n=1 Tax=Halomarina halobia TaxID=3033386 RepID=A0ABD6A4I4_9EURY|nr:DUF4013 domain-containing protein [Halomarina sp. PSR21]
MFRDALLYPLSGTAAAGSYLLGCVLRLVLTVSDLVVLFAAITLAAETVDAVPADATSPSVLTLAAALALSVVLSLVVRTMFRGHAVGVAREVAGEPRPVAPSVRAFVRADAVRSLGVVVAYLLPALALVGLAALTVAIDAGEGLGAVVDTVGALSLLFGLLAGLLATYLVPVATVRFAQEGDVRAAFDLSAVRAAAFTEDYVVGWAMAAGVVVVLVPIALLLYALLLVGVVVHFHLNVVTRYLLARAASAALADDPDEAGEGDDADGDRESATEVSLDHTASARAAAEADWRGSRPEPTELDPTVADDDPAADEFRRRR